VTEAPTLDLAGYHVVLIVKTDEVEGHVYRRGSRHTVDATTLASLRDRGLVEPDGVTPAGAAPSGGR